jgi:hypothetical protein
MKRLKARIGMEIDSLIKSIIMSKTREKALALLESLQ